ncbi:MAG: response regulator transcription factor [Clostridiales bacterium]|jgi:DNA-binding NarL/FixJ family response regulator|nr:response regulator transcription factor [Clostridiales bacterium]
MIRIAVADDQTLLREMLAMILSQDEEFEVVGEAGNGKEILEICRDKQPGVVLLDIKMPTYDGVYALSAIKSEFPAVKVIMLTTFGDEKNVLDAYNGGADGYILKDIKPHMLAMTVKCVRDGLFVMHESIHSILRKRIGVLTAGKAAQLDAAEELYDEYGLDLTDRKVIRLLINGKSNREIAEALSFSEGTIKNRISRILSITGQKDRTQIAVFALKNDLI